MKKQHHKLFLLSNLIYFTAILFSVNSVLSQSFRSKLQLTETENIQRYFTLNDSINTAGIVFNNKAMYKALKIGIFSGLGGAVAGLAASYFIMLGENECDIMCPYVILPPLIGTSAFIIGTVAGYAINYGKRHEFTNYAYNKRKFKQLGFFITLSPVLEYEHNYQIMGISYRNTYPKYYLPNQISLLVGGRYRGHNYVNGGKDVYAKIEDTIIGLKLVKTNYNKMLSLLYGVEVGYFSSKAKSHYVSGNDYESNPFKIDKYSSAYIDLIIGFNVNIFSFLNFESFYSFEPYDPSTKFMTDDINSRTYSNKISFSFMIYFW